MKPFDLEAFKNGAVAVTRDGHDAHFIAVDTNLAAHTQLLFRYGFFHSRHLGARGLDGQGATGWDSSTDLVGMRPTKKTYWVNVMLSDNGVVTFDPLPHKTKEEALNDHPRWWGKLIGTYPIEIEE